MKAKDFVTITSVALGTATLTILLFGSASLEAGKEAEPLAAKIAQPKLVANGIELTLDAAAHQTFKAGDRPEFVLQAVNSTAETASVALHVAMTGTARMSELSRLMPMPAMLWQHPLSITLAPNESKSFTLPTGTRLPENQLIAVVLQEGNEGQNQKVPVLPSNAPQTSRIVALSFSTVNPPAQPTVASVR